MCIGEALRGDGGAVGMMRDGLLGFFVGVLLVVGGRWLHRRWGKSLAANFSFFSATETPPVREKLAEGRGRGALCSEHHPRLLADEHTENEEEEWDTEDEDDDSTELETSDDDSQFESLEDLRLKMVLVLRRDPKTTTAQDSVTLAAGAAMSLVQKVQSDTEHAQWRTWHAWWRRVGCAKITLKCPDEETLRRIAAEVEASGLPWHSAASCSSFAANGEPTGRVVAVGPAPSDVLDPITGKLKLLS